MYTKIPCTLCMHEFIQIENQNHINSANALVRRVARAARARSLREAALALAAQSVRSRTGSSTQQPQPSRW